MVEHWLRKFEHRCKVLFIEGQIMTMKNTYVAQILEFYRDPSIIFAAKHAIMFVKPEGTDEEAMFEPLEWTSDTNWAIVTRAHVPRRHR